LQPGPSHVQLLPQVHVAPAAHCSVQLPLEHVALQLEPDAHVVEQSPLVHETLHVAPAGQVVLQSPLSHVIVQGPAPHVLLQSPLVQLTLHGPLGGHVGSQSALEHAQLPVVHAHAPEGHATGGGYDGPELHATTAAKSAAQRDARSLMATPG
jgi:hypothetical protein